MSHPHIHTEALLVAAIVIATSLVPVVRVEAQSGARTSPTPAPTPRPNSLAELARRIKLRPVARDADGKLVISNSSLSELAAQGSLTTTTGTTGARSDSRRYVDVDRISDQAGSEQGATGSLNDDQKRNYWRDRYSGQLQTVDAVKKRIGELDSEIPKLWNQFYAWDDPAYRDGVIKPNLDRALAESQQLKDRLPGEEAKLDQILEEARRDGAQPGWFRDLRP